MTDGQLELLQRASREWRSSLIDVSGNNRLLYFRPTASSINLEDAPTSAMQEQVREFMEATGGGPLMRSGPKVPLFSNRQLSRRLIEEEGCEVIEALCFGDLPHIAKELADLLYVTFFAANKYGIDLAPVFAEVHRSNMSKLGDDGKAIYDDGGKVLKGPNYSPADVARVIAAQGNEEAA